jgi:hypothetical protein
MKTELSEKEQIQTLAKAVLQVIEGLRREKISAKPMMVIDPQATEFEVTSLEIILWRALNKCGIEESK